MKLARLLLQAFGPFTATELDFAGGQSATNLHLIYGPNEAGKSSALRAMTDLRFGIPLRSQDDFLHPANQLRIAGVFLDAAGAPLGLVRRKGRGATLSRFDVATGQAAVPEVGRDEEAALTGGLGRDEFEAMFGLNHGRLREGGDLLLKGEGELGAALFEASAGTRSIAAILAGLDANAKELYNPHGRAQSATINEARRQLDEQRQLWRQAQIRPADWQALNRAHEQARGALGDIERALESQRRQENELTELRTVEPLLREHDRALAELQGLDDIPDLAAGAREARLAAEQARRRAGQDLQAAEAEVQRCTDALAPLVIERALLDHGEAIERLAAAAEAVTRSRIEGRQQQAVGEGIGAAMAAAAARIAAQRPIDELLPAVPSNADRVELERHLEASGRLGERLQAYRDRAEELDGAQRQQADGTAALAEPALRERLLAALAAAQELGDVSRHSAEAEPALRDLAGQLSQALADLDCPSAEALARARPLLDAQIVAARKALADAEEAARSLGEEDSRLAEDLRQQRQRQRQLAAAGELVTAQTLRLARERRNLGWSLVRQVYVEGRGDAADAGRQFDAARPLAEAFEAAQSDADRQADLLRADATRAAGYEECASRIEDMAARRADIAQRLTALGARRQELQADWGRRLAAAGLPALDPEALREWQNLRAGALEIADRLAQAQARQEQRQTEAATVAAALAAALAAVGEAVDSLALARLIGQADRWEKRATKAEAEQSARVQAEAARRMERQKVAALLDKTDGELAGHLAALEAWHARLFLPAGSRPETVKARLEELDGLARQAAALAEAKLRRAQLQAAVEDFASQAAHLAAALGEPAPAPGMAEDLVDRLKRRLAASREQEQLRNTLVRDRRRAQEAQGHAEAELAAQTATLARLCAAAGVAAAEALPEREDAASRKGLRRAEVAALRQQLARASSRGEEELRARLAGRDALALDGERERCRGEIARLEQEQAAARQAEEQARRALEAIDASDRAAKAREAMEAAAARYRSAIRPWARLKLAQALLEESLRRFRERAQAPMVAAASSYFALMTGGRYPRLVADEADNKPVLRAERDDGQLIGVAAMSEGTADQLYLALRLAALELRRASHPQMPLILDDVLVTSDDQRAANVLRALARFAEGGQVMLFTHHRHLIDLGRHTLGSQVLAIHSL